MKEVNFAYGKNEVQDVGELLVRAQRDNGKVLVRDVLRDVGFRKDMELKLEREQKIDRGPNIDRGHRRSR